MLLNNLLGVQKLPGLPEKRGRPEWVGCVLFAGMMVLSGLDPLLALRWERKGFFWGWGETGISSQTSCLSHHGHPPDFVVVWDGEGWLGQEWVSPALTSDQFFFGAWSVEQMCLAIPSSFSLRLWSRELASHPSWHPKEQSRGACDFGLSNLQRGWCNTIGSLSTPASFRLPIFPFWGGGTRASSWCQILISEFSFDPESDKYPANHGKHTWNPHSLLCKSRSVRGTSNCTDPSLNLVLTW